MQRIAAVSLILAASFTPIYAVQFAGGTGQPNDPYQIATAEQLIAMGQSSGFSDRHFVLTADIDLDPNLPGGSLFREAVISHPTGATGRRGDRLVVSFEGGFDGAGHAIRNCTVYAQNYGLNAALFHSIGPQGCVRNLRLENVMIAGIAASFSGYCAALAGENAGLIVNCSADGMVVAGGQLDHSGGLVGVNTGTMIRCRCRCDVSGTVVGGLVGRNNALGLIEFCSADGVVIDTSSTASEIGGLIAVNLGVVRCCSSEGYVLADRAGGLVGTNSGTIRESCSPATLVGGVSSGGIAAVNSGTILNCYVPVCVPGDGLAGANTGSIASCYSVTASRPAPATRGRSVRSGSLAAEAGGPAVRYVYYLDAGKADTPAARLVSFAYGMPLSPMQMADRSSFVGFDFHGDANDGAEDHWFMPSEGYPVLAWQTRHTGLTGIPDVTALAPEQAQARLELAGFDLGGIDYDYFAEKETCYLDATRRYCETFCPRGRVAHVLSAGYVTPGTPVRIAVSLGPYDFAANAGDGSEARPFQIETAGQIDGLRVRPDLWNRHFVLAADIDLTHRIYRRAVIDSFEGTFDGKGHCIRGMVIQRPEPVPGPVGLFGTIAEGALVRNRPLQGAARASQGDRSVDARGLLAGENHGHVERCLVSGRIGVDGGRVGGLAGLNTGQVLDSQARGATWASRDDVGGLVGDNQGPIQGCCARQVDVYGYSRVGGLAGSNHGDLARIQACYAQGTVQASYYPAGGLLGENGAGVSVQLARFEAGGVSDCYAACSVVARTGAGGCIGHAYPFTSQTGCFFLAAESGGGPDNGLGMPLTPAQMTQQTSFVGWDFENTWTICEGRDYPRVRCEPVECEGGS